MFEQCHNEVIGLKRIRMKNLVLDESLAPGEYRPLTEEEITELKRPL
jgi:16S rRNA pseudouridine516 synthase